MWTFHFPIEDGTATFSGGDHGGSHIKKRRAQWRSSRKFGRVSANGRNEGWQRSPKRFLGDRTELHFSSSRRTQNSTPRAEGRIIPNTTAMHWRGQENTHTTLDVLQESRVYDYWNIDANGNLSEPWTRVTQFTIVVKNFLTDMCGPESGLQKFKQPHGLINCCQRFGPVCQKQLNERKKQQ